MALNEQRRLIFNEMSAKVEAMQPDASLEYLKDTAIVAITGLETGFGAQTALAVLAALAKYVISGTNLVAQADAQAELAKGATVQ